MKDKIILWWKYEAKSYPRDFFIGIKNLFIWFPIIWKDRNWGHTYIYNVLEFKLRNQSKYIKSRNYHESALQDARNMKIVVNLIEKVKDEFYHLEYLDYAETEAIKHFDNYFKKYPLIYKQVLEGKGIYSLDNRYNSKEHTIALNMAHINQQRAQNLIFKIMNEHINSWWN